MNTSPDCSVFRKTDVCVHHRLFFICLSLCRFLQPGLSLSSEDLPFHPTKTGLAQRARTHCLKHFVDVASVADVKDLAEMSGLVNTADEHVFLGLTREWEWTVLDSEDHRQTQIGFEAFGAGEPREEHECGMIQASGEWRTETCNTKWPFVCLDGQIQDCGVQDLQFSNSP
ncbi:hypothetical protein NQD34_013491 [Periophthalmus magnuspinnatus]|nr:hypothetical protein NQD34_013491 [Periophthalmus magnuspinnatus]